MRKISIFNRILRSTTLLVLIFSCQACVGQRFTVAGLFNRASSLGSAVPPIDEREVTFPSDMTIWGWLDVTKKGAQVKTGVTPDPGCPDALPNQADTASVNQTTQAIQCRLDNLGLNTNSGSLYFPAGVYYINKSLSLTPGYEVQNPDGSYTYVYRGNGDRSNWSGEVHISGQNPATTQIVWAGSCGPDPNIASPATVIKYNDIFYFDSIAPLTVERLTLDGKNCAGDGIDMVSKPGDMSGVSINEMVIQNLKEVGIIGDRPNITKDEVIEGDTTGMVSEVTIEKVTFNHVGYACVMPDAPNAVDWWIRDSVFNDCNIAITNGNGGTGNWVWPGMPQTPGLPWGNGGVGGFEVANCLFENSRTVDIMGGSSVRNSYSIASHGPFLEVYGEFLAQGNTVIASKGVIPVVSWGGTAGLNVDQLVLLKNKFITQNDTPAVVVWTMVWGQSYPVNAYQGASPAVGNIWNETYSNVASIGNQYSSTRPFSTASAQSISKDPLGVTDLPGWAASTSQVLQCGPVGGVSTPIDDRTYCSFSGPNFNPVYNLLTFDDELGVSMTPSPPVMAPIRPEVQRKYIIPTLSAVNSLAAANANAAAIQTALNTLAANQAHCSSADYFCPDRWGIVFIPPGIFPIGTTIDVPGSVQLQIVGSGQSDLYWFLYGKAVSGPSAILKLHSPSHVVIRDLSLFGEPDIHMPNPIGEGLIAEVTDLATSRVFSDRARLWGSFDVSGVGNAAFEMRSFQNGGPSTIMGNGGQNAGYFAYFSGNPTNITIGHGANLMIQDTWYEGDDSRLVSCANGDQANMTVESSSISMGGWHGVHADTLTTFNIGGCNTKTAVITSGVGRDGWAGLAPTQSFILPSTATAQTRLLLLGNTTINSNYGNSEDPVPATYASSIDQGYLSVDSASQAQYADLFGSFYQSVVDKASTTDRAQLASRQAGNIQSTFIRSMLGQAVDPRQRAPSLLVAPITDMQSTDIRLENVWTAGARMDMQFILPGAAAQ